MFPSEGGKFVMILLVYFTFFGLIIGSFLNVVVARLRSGEGFMTRSHCVKCDALIHWYDNVPVLSFLWLRGRCRACGARISWQYPSVELATALLFAIVGTFVFDVFRSESWIDTAFWLVLVSSLVVVFVYDLLYLEIPMLMIWIGIGGAILWLGAGEWQLALMGMWSVWDSILIGNLAAGLGAFAVFGAISKGSGERLMGMGDAWLMLLLGLVIGWPGILWTVTIGSGLGSIVGVALIALRKKGMRSELPYGPFLIIGFFAVVCAEWIFNQVWL